MTKSVTKEGVLAEIEMVAHDLEHELSTVGVLYQRRDALYVDAQQAGATYREIAAVSGVSMNAVKFTLTQQKRKK